MGQVGEITKICDRLLRPYFIWGILFVPIYYCFGKLQFGMLHAFGDVIMGRGSGALWYLYTVALIELSTWGGLRLGRINSHSWLKNVFVLACVMMCCAVIKLSDGRLGYDLGVWFFVYFLVGLFVRRVVAGIPNCFIGLFMAALVFAVCDVSRGTLWNFGWVFSLIAFLAWLFKTFEESAWCKILEYLGTHSLTLLVFHPIFNPICSKLASPFVLLESKGILADCVI